MPLPTDFILNFEARRHDTMTTLFRSALSEYQLAVEGSQKTFRFVIANGSLRWFGIIIAIALAPVPTAFQLFGFLFIALCGISQDLGSFFMLRRRQLYYRNARDHLVRCADSLAPGVDVPLITKGPGVDPGPKVRAVVAAIMTTFLVADFALFAVVLVAMTRTLR
jgi:hypothetical protein